ncbi:hypothetical protein HNV11_23810 (plasmid) [Spirosoma taeanense]|uniref:Uncharacterized protein n=1 Tax=Spirosoma taeanense TaxID=2735870 RepID=A0A6M5YGN1_9BACT|nr:hypothetical protein [Spirosoma taeanense]QJW92501.1 hypothetical protein HNV11_23810 [Spirosoma taeanense]
MPYRHTTDDQPTYNELRGTFAGAADALSESEPEPTYVPTPRRWQVGDLLKHRTYGNCLILRKQVGVFHNYDLIAEDGYQFQTQEPTNFLHNTGLTYQYKDFAQTASDYRAGLFTPYFEIL